MASQSLIHEHEDSKDFLSYCSSFRSAYPQSACLLRGPLAPSSVSGLVTTVEVRGETKLYFRDISRVLAVVLLFSSGEPS
ncbi:unnamed protein product [Lota lota]